MHRRLILTVAICALLIDQVSKVWAVHALSDGHSIQVISHFVQFTLARNAGAAFSIATGATALLSLVSVLACLAIIRFSVRVTYRPWAWVFGGVLGGAAGNVIDRLVRSPGIFRGHVVDFIELPNYPIFNLADSSIVCSAVLAVWLTFRGVSWDTQGLMANATHSEINTAIHDEPNLKHVNDDGAQ